MARRKRPPEENEPRARIRELLQLSNVSSMEDIHPLFFFGAVDKVRFRKNE